MDSNDSGGTVGAAPWNDLVRFRSAGTGPPVVRASLESFEALYRDDPDPWRFATSAYEQRRYDLTAAVLQRPRYRRCFEPGCAIGELTRRLARRCDTVVALEPSSSALAVARDRLRALSNVDLRAGALPEDWPEGDFDLVVLSEVGYYFETEGVRYLAERTLASLAKGGEVVAAHWRGRSEDHLLHADAVHAELRRELGPPVCQYEQAEFRLDLWSPA